MAAVSRGRTRATIKIPSWSWDPDLAEEDIAWLTGWPRCRAGVTWWKPALWDAGKYPTVRCYASEFAKLLCGSSWWPFMGRCLNSSIPLQNRQRSTQESCWLPQPGAAKCCRNKMREEPPCWVAKLWSKLTVLKRKSISQCSCSTLCWQNLTWCGWRRKAKYMTISLSQSRQTEMDVELKCNKLITSTTSQFILMWPETLWWENLTKTTQENYRSICFLKLNIKVLKKW